jgi:hypothetical protein
MNPTCACALGAGLAHYPSCSYQAPHQTTSPHRFPVSRFDQIHYLHICSCIYVHVCMNMHVCILVCAWGAIRTRTEIILCRKSIVCAYVCMKWANIDACMLICMHVCLFAYMACIFMHARDVGRIQTICKPMPTLTPGKVTCKLTCCKSSEQLFPWAC